MYTIYKFVFYFFCFHCLAFGYENSRATPELEMLDMFIGRQDLELSGVTYNKLRKEIMVVSDNNNERFIYQLELDKQNHFTLNQFINLEKLNGFSEYKALFENKKNRKHFIDLEGITSCDNTIYGVNERLRHVFKIESNKFTYLDINFSKFRELFQGGKNSGFEAIAINCKTKTLYVSKEKKPATLLVIQLKSTPHILTNIIKLDSSSTRVKSQQIDSIADMYYQDGYLYMLAKNSSQVVKYDLKTNLITAKFTYNNTEKKLYKSKKKSKMAEGLYLFKDKIVITFDNNHKALQDEIIKKFKLKNNANNSSIISFKRPKNF